MRGIKKAISLWLCLCLLLGVLPVISPPVMAAADDEETALGALGFDDQEEPDGFVSGDEAATPYGVDVTTVAPVSELYLLSSFGESLFGHDLALGVSSEQFLASGQASHDLNFFSGYQAAAGSFDGSGLDRQVAMITLGDGSAEKSFDLVLRITDPAEGMTLEQMPAISLLDDCQGFANGIDTLVSEKDYVQNYLQLAAGDFNGDGTDEIAVYLPEAGNPRVVVYQARPEDGETWKDASVWEELITYVLPYSTIVPNMVSLAVGDATGDGVDDLALSWGGRLDYSLYEASKAVVLSGSKAGQALQESISLPLGTEQGKGFLRGSLAFGDGDGDGKEELVFSGQSIYDLTAKGDDFKLYTRQIALFEYNLEEESLVRAFASNVDLKDGDNNWQFLSNPLMRTGLALVKKDGVASQEYVFADGILFKLSDGAFSVSQFIMTPIGDGMVNMGSFYGVVAADFNGDGKETIASMIYTPSLSAAPVRGVHCETTYPDENADPKPEISDYFQEFLDVWGTFAAPNTDTDTMVMKYTGQHYLAYSDPKVLALVAAPPYFSDLGHLDGGDSYIGNSETVFASSAGTSQGGITSATLTVGAYLTFETGFKIFGYDAAKFEAEAELTASFTVEQERMSTMTQTVEYATTGGQDTVALYSLPMDVYVYTAYVPVSQDNGSVEWEEQTMTVNVPYEACVRTLTVEDYDAIAANYDSLPAIRGQVLTSEPGDPASYPSSLGEYSTPLVYEGSYAGVGYGDSGYIKQTLEMEEETTTTLMAQVGLTAKFGVGGGGVVVGGIAGAEIGFGAVKSKMAGSAFSGTVFGMPSEAEEYGYGYNWKIFQYLYDDGTVAFPVVSYMVNSLSAPAKLPTDFALDVNALSSDSIRLTWKSKDAKAAGFQLYRYYEFPDGQGSYPLGQPVSVEDYVDFDPATGLYTYAFTDTGLAPYTEYKYCIQTISETAPHMSVLSEILSCYTAPDQGQPVIFLSDRTLRVYPDQEKALTVNVINQADNALAPLYQWQRRVDGEWIDLTSQTYAALRFVDASMADTGTYRCRVNQRVGDYYISAFSDTVEVSVAKRTVSMDTDVFKDMVADMTPLITSTLSNNSQSGSIPSGTVTYEITGSEYSQTVTVEVDFNGVARLSDWTAPQAGVYTIEARYNGNRIFKTAATDSLLMAGGNSGFWMEADKKMIYGDSLKPEVARYVGDGDSVQKTYLSAQEEVEGYSLSYQIYRYTSNREDPVAIEKYIQETYAGYPPLQDLFRDMFRRLPDMSIWLLMDEASEYYPLSQDGTITPRAVDNYRIDAYVTDAQGQEVRRLIQDLDVNPRPVTVTAPTWIKPQAEASQPHLTDLTISQGNLVFDESLASLGINIACYDSGYKAVQISSSTNPGVYQTRAIADYNIWMQRSNYQFTFVNGTYTVTGPVYPVTLAADLLMDRQVGGIKVLSPAGFSQGQAYQYGTQVVFAASPDQGYVVREWRVNGQVVDPDSLANPNLLMRTMQNEGMDVSVAFKVQESTLEFGGENGRVVCTDSGLLESGMNVIAGATYTFKALPDAGYHFKAWRLYAGGLTNPQDVVTADGEHTCVLTMGSYSTNLVAVFERDSYQLDLGDHLTATYLWDDDEDQTSPEVEKTVKGTVMVEGDKAVTVEASPGYEIAPGGKWYANGDAVLVRADDPNTPEDETVYYTGQTYQFTMEEASRIEADTELQYYDVTVATGWTGSGVDPGENAVRALVNGTATELDALKDLAGGSAVVLLAVPAYGCVFDHWEVNGTHLSTVAEYACGALTEDLAVTAVFRGNQAYAVEVTKDSHGGLSYRLNGGEPVVLGDQALTASIPVYQGDSLVFTATPDSEFMVGSWTQDGERTQTTEKTWTISEIGEDVTLDLHFTAMVYFTVRFSAGDYGTVSALMDSDYVLTSGEHPGGGTEIQFTASPASGYMVDRWTLNGDLVESCYGTDLVDRVYTIEALSGDAEVLVSFREEQAWTVTLPDSQENYGLAADFSPDAHAYTGTTGLVRDGATAVFTVTPEAGYMITSVTASGATVHDFDSVEPMPDGAWICRLNRVVEDLELAVVAEKAYEVVVSTVEGGRAEADPAVCTAGSEVSLAARANEGYRFDGWTVSGLSGTAIALRDEDARESSFIMPAENVTVTAAFVREGGNSGGGSSSGGAYVFAPAEAFPERITIAELDGNSIYATLRNTDVGSLVDISRYDFNRLSEGDLVTIDLGTSKMFFDADAWLSVIDRSMQGDIQLIMKLVDPAGLSLVAQARIGDRPVYDFTLKVDQTLVADFGRTVHISIPYMLKAGEDEHALVAYHVNDLGVPRPVRGTFNMQTGTMEFDVSHFSTYGVGYHPVAFDDVDEKASFYDAVTFCAARDITGGTGDGLFSPQGSLTRAQFLVMLMRAYGLEADKEITDNFDDAGNTYYTGYLAAAKRMGISKGVGDNRFAPEEELTRQDMMTLLYRALDLMGELPDQGSQVQLSDFSDAGLIADYAKEACACLLGAGAIAGDEGRLQPLVLSTRALMVQVLYNLLAK